MLPPMSSICMSVCPTRNSIPRRTQVKTFLIQSQVSQFKKSSTFPNAFLTPCLGKYPHFLESSLPFPGWSFPTWYLVEDGAPDTRNGSANVQNQTNPKWWRNQNGGVLHVFSFYDAVHVICSWHFHIGGYTLKLAKKIPYSQVCLPNNASS